MLFLAQATVYAVHFSIRLMQLDGSSRTVETNKHYSRWATSKYRGNPPCIHSSIEANGRLVVRDINSVGTNDRQVS
jgi:hypothetical protein